MCVDSQPVFRDRAAFPAGWREEETVVEVEIPAAFPGSKNKSLVYSMTKHQMAFISVFGCVIHKLYPLVFTHVHSFEVLGGL